MDYTFENHPSDILHLYGASTFNFGEQRDSGCSKLVKCKTETETTSNWKIDTLSSSEFEKNLRKTVYGLYFNQQDIRLVFVGPGHPTLYSNHLQRLLVILASWRYQWSTLYLFSVRIVQFFGTDIYYVWCLDLLFHFMFRMCKLHFYKLKFVFFLRIRHFLCSLVWLKEISIVFWWVETMSLCAISHVSFPWKFITNVFISKQMDFSTSTWDYWVRWVAKNNIDELLF